MASLQVAPLLVHALGWKSVHARVGAQQLLLDPRGIGAKDALDADWVVELRGLSAAEVALGRHIRFHGRVGGLGMTIPAAWAKE